MSFTIIIPARYASSRLPGKPLLDIGGKPMIQHVWERASASAAERVVIATEDQRVFERCVEFGAEVCMTRASHESGTDRLQEVASQLDLADDAIVVNVQGDEPLIPAQAIEQVANNLAAQSTAAIATLAEAIEDAATLFNPNVVKVVRDRSKLALYFSRAAMPWNRDDWTADTLAAERSLVEGAYLRHIGIYAYRVAFLHQFVQWPAGALEGIEKLEQLRAMENGVRIHVDVAGVAIPGGVDTLDDLELVRGQIAGPGSAG